MLLMMLRLFTAAICWRSKKNWWSIAQIGRRPEGGARRGQCCWGWRRSCLRDLGRWRGGRQLWGNLQKAIVINTLEGRLKMFTYRANWKNIATFYNLSEATVRPKNKVTTFPRQPRHENGGGTSKFNDEIELTIEIRILSYKGVNHMLEVQDA